MTRDLWGMWLRKPFNIWREEPANRLPGLDGALMCAWCGQSFQERPLLFHCSRDCQRQRTIAVQWIERARDARP
jgi:hypothetical protein